MGFLNTFQELQKGTIMLVMPVCLSVCPSAWSNTVPTERIFVKFYI